MADRIFKFIDAFETAINERETRGHASPHVGEARRAIRKLTAALTAMTERGVILSVTPADLDVLDGELQGLQRPAPPITGSIDQAERLLQVIQDGLVEGDGERLRELVSRAKGASPVRASGKKKIIPLERPVRVRCDDCAAIVAGQSGLVRWGGVAKAVRSHQSSNHGSLSEALRSELVQARELLLGGADSAKACQYEIHVLPSP